MFLNSNLREIAVPPARMSAAAARFLGDVFLREQDGFVEVGVEIRLHPRAVRLFRPFDEVFDGSLGTVGIVDFQAAAHRREFVADGLQCFRRLDREHGRRAFVAADAVPGEIVRGIVPDFRTIFMKECFRYVRETRDSDSYYSIAQERRFVKGNRCHFPFIPTIISILFRVYDLSALRSKRNQPPGCLFLRNRKNVFARLEKTTGTRYIMCKCTKRGYHGETAERT